MESYNDTSNRRCYSEILLVTRVVIFIPLYPARRHWRAEEKTIVDSVLTSRGRGVTARVCLIFPCFLHFRLFVNWHRTLGRSIEKELGEKEYSGSREFAFSSLLSWASPRARGRKSVSRCVWLLPYVGGSSCGFPSSLDVSLFFLGPSRTRRSLSFLLDRYEEEKGGVLLRTFVFKKQKNRSDRSTSFQRLLVQVYVHLPTPPFPPPYRRHHRHHLPSSPPPSSFAGWRADLRLIRVRCSIVFFFSLG